MQSRLIIAANVITLLIVGYVAIQVKNARNTSAKRGVSASTILKRANALIEKGDYITASGAFAQVQRIGPPALKAEARIGRLKADALSLVATRTLPEVLLPKATELQAELQTAVKGGEPYAVLLEAVQGRANGQITPELAGSLATLAGRVTAEPVIATWATWLQGTLDAQAGRIDVAIGAFRSTIERFPEFAEGHAALGAALLEMGEQEAGKAALARAVGIALERRNYLQRIQLLSESGAYAEVLKLTAPDTSEGLSRQQALFYRAAAFARLKRTDEARKAYEGFLQALPAGINEDHRSRIAKRYIEDHSEPAPPAASPTQDAGPQTR